MTKSGEKLIKATYEALDMAKLMKQNEALEKQLAKLTEEFSGIKEEKDRAWSMYYDIRKDRDEYKALHQKAQNNFEEERSMANELRKDVNRCLGWIAAKRDEHPLGEKANGPLSYRSDLEWRP